MLHVRLCPRDLMLIPVTLVTLVTLLHFRGFCFREHQVVRHVFLCVLHVISRVPVFVCPLSHYSVLCDVQDKDYFGSFASVHNHRALHIEHLQASEVQTFSLNSRSFTKICINCLLYTTLHFQTSKLSQIT